jgi:hypothetical protein
VKALESHEVWARTLRPLVRWWMLRQSPYYGSRSAAP